MATAEVVKVTLSASGSSELESDAGTDVEGRMKKKKQSTSRKTEEKRPLIVRSDSDESHKINEFFSDPEFNAIVCEAEKAILEGVLPERIYQGSSGSYFVKNSETEKIGVFKPKDEEPYGQLNPKWTKWLHGMCCPCCFGRSCLIPNQGYLSEAGASIIDQKFGLGVVPLTKVVHLASETFNYHFADRWKIRMRQFATEQWPDTIGKKVSTDLPLKVGSLQMFVNGYKDAKIHLEEFQSEPLPAQIQQQFQLEFERLVVLDYIIRNTDRGDENWLVKYEPPVEDVEEALERWKLTPATDCGTIKIAAIDNGLAFPFKHPDEWRAYPFYWAWLPMAKVPFSDTIAEQVLDKLKSKTLVEALVVELREVFSRDKGFDRFMFEKQMAVLRGQILNLTKALESRKTPWELVNMPPTVVESVTDGTSRTERFIQRFRDRAPFFNSC